MSQQEIDAAVAELQKQIERWKHNHGQPVMVVTGHDRSHQLIVEALALITANLNELSKRVAALEGRHD